MNMEAGAEKQGLEMQESAEVEPGLLTDPEEAAAWLEGVWRGSGEWKSQHQLLMKVKEPGDYQALSEEEKAQYDSFRRQFSWIAEMYRSEMMWSQSYTQTNQGEVYAFRFGYDIPEKPEDEIPNAYVYRPFDEKQPTMFVSRGSEGWRVEPLSDVSARYEQNFV